VIKADFSLVAFFVDFKSDPCAVPLGFVFNEVEEAVQNKPDDFLARN